MGRSEGQHNVYIPKEEWRLLCEARKRTGVSVSKQLVSAYRYWIKNNPKALQDLAEQFERISEVREAKEQERKTGDFLGSFEKKKEKINRIKRRVKNGDITEEVGKILIRQTKDRYEQTQRAYEEIILKNEESEKKKKHSLKHWRKIFNSTRKQRMMLKKRQEAERAKKETKLEARVHACI